ncbi:mCG145652, partial [Mus musculus]
KRSTVYASSPREVTRRISQHVCKPVSCYVAWPLLDFVIFFQLPECWDYRKEPLHSASQFK